MSDNGQLGYETAEKRRNQVARAWRELFPQLLEFYGGSRVGRTLYNEALRVFRERAALLERWGRVDEELLARRLGCRTSGRPL